MPTVKPHAGVKQRVEHELVEYAAVSGYLAVFLVALVTYRKLVLAEYDIGYSGYGWAVIQALVLGKVILIGEAMHVGRRAAKGPILVAALWMTVAFGFLEVGFSLLEHGVQALLHHRTLREQFLHDGATWLEILARAVLLVVGLFPLFLYRQLDRVLGENRLRRLLFRVPEAPTTTGKGS